MQQFLGMSSSVHIDNKKRHFNSWKGSNTRIRRAFISLSYNGGNSYLIVNCIELTKFKSKDFGVITDPLCLGNISQDFPTNDMKNMGLYGNVYEFNVYYQYISVDNMLNIHKYLIKRPNIV